MSVKGRKVGLARISPRTDSRVVTKELVTFLTVTTARQSFGLILAEITARAPFEVASLDASADRWCDMHHVHVRTGNQTLRNFSRF